MQPLSNTELFNYHKLFLQYGTSVFEETPRLHLQQLFGYVNEFIIDAINDTMKATAKNMDSYPIPEKFRGGQEWVHFALLNTSLKEYIECRITLLLILKPELSKLNGVLDKLNHIQQYEFTQSYMTSTTRIEKKLTYLNSFNVGRMEEQTVSVHPEFDGHILSESTFYLEGFPIYFHKSEYYRQFALELCSPISPPPSIVDFFHHYVNEARSHRNSKLLMSQTVKDENFLLWLYQKELECYQLVSENLAYLIVDEKAPAKATELRNNFQFVCESFMTWLENENKSQSTLSKQKSSEQNEYLNEKSFKELFVSDKAFDQFIQVLISKDYIHPITHIWVGDFWGKGLTLIKILKSLHGKGYLKQKEGLSAKQIEILSHEFFQNGSKRSHIHKTQFLSKEVEFIPTWNNSDK